MATYLVLGKFTDKGISTIEESPERIKRFKEIAQGEGAKVISWYLLMGKYDVACIIEAPTPEVMAKLDLIVGKRGNLRTLTMVAFNEKEHEALISKLG